MSQPTRQLPNGLFDRAALASQLARAPVQSSQAIENCSPDAKLRIAAKLYFLGWIEFDESVHQSHHSRRDQILDVHMLGQPFVNSSGQKPHNRQMFEQHPFLLVGEHRQLGSIGRIAAFLSAPARRSLLFCCIRRFHTH